MRLLLVEDERALAEATSDPAARIDALRREIEHHTYLYYAQAAPEISDAAFDSLMRRWDDETTKLNKVLIDLEDALRGTQADKSALEESTVSTITGLGSMMNS